MATAELRRDADRPITGRGLFRLVDGGLERFLRPAAGLDLLFGVCEIIAFTDRLRLGDLPSVVIDENFREFPVLSRVDGELEVTFVDLEFARDRFP